MKRTIRLLALILTLTLALSAAAMATKIDYGKGKTNATKSVSAVSLVEGCTVAFEGEKLNVTYTNSALKEGDMVIVFLLETKDKDGKITEVKTEEAAQTLIVPTAENIKYIDQSVAKATASNGSVSFDIYPQNHTSALVRIISVNAATNKVTDENIAAVKLNYTLGDVTGEGEVNAVDALRILQYAANVGNPKYEFSAPWAAGDVDLNGEISGVDAVRILQYAANDGNPKYALGK